MHGNASTNLMEKGTSSIQIKIREKQSFSPRKQCKDTRSKLLIHVINIYVYKAPNNHLMASQEIMNKFII